MPDRVLVDLQLAARPEVIGFQRLLNRINRELAAVNLDQIRVNPRSLNQTITQVRALRAGLGAANTGSQQLNNQINRLVRGADAINRFERALRTPTTVMGDLGRQTAITTRRFGVFLFISQGLRQVTSSLGQGVREAVAFNSELRKTTQLLSRGGLQLSGIGSVAGVQEAISRNARSLGADSNELIQVSNTLAQAGRSISEIRSIINDLSAASLTATFSDLGNSAENVQAILGQFRLGVNQLRPVLDSLNSVTKNYNVSIEELFTGLRKAGTTFAALSGVNENALGAPENLQSFREFAAIFTSIIQTSRESADVVGTSLRTIIPRLQRGNTLDQLRELGVELRDQNGNFVGAFEAISRIADALKNVSAQSATFSTVVESVGGLRQFNRALPLFENIGVARDAIRIQQESEGSVDRDVQLALQDLVVQLRRVREEFRDIFREFSQTGGFEILADTVIGLARSFTALANALLQLGPLTPILGAIGAVSLSRSGFGGFGNFGRQFGRNFTPSRFNRGGSVGRARLNAGGRPVALTPGEMVFTPDQVSKIPGGYRTLDQLNSGRNVGSFSPPQGVGIVPGTGSTDSFFTSLPEGSFVLRKKVAEKILAKGFQGFNAGGGVGRQRFVDGGLLGGGRQATQALLRENRNLFREFARAAKAQGQDVKRVTRLVAQNLRAGVSPQELRSTFREGLLPGRRRQSAIDTFSDPANQIQIRRNEQRVRIAQERARVAQERAIRRQTDIAALRTASGEGLLRLGPVNDFRSRRPPRTSSFINPVTEPPAPRTTRGSRLFNRLLPQGNIFRGLGGPAAALGVGFLGTQLSGSNNSFVSGAGQTLTGAATGFAVGGVPGAVIGALGGATSALLSFQRAAQKAAESEFFQSVDKVGTLEDLNTTFGSGSENSRLLNNVTRLALQRGSLSRSQREELEARALPVREQSLEIFRNLSNQGLSTSQIFERVRSQPRAFKTLLDTFSATNPLFREFVAENPNLSGSDLFDAQVRALKFAIAQIANNELDLAQKLKNFISSVTGFDAAIRAAQNRLNDFQVTLSNNRNAVNALFGQVGGTFVGAGRGANRIISNGRIRGTDSETFQAINTFFNRLGVNRTSGFADLSRRQATLSAAIGGQNFTNFLVGQAAANRQQSIGQLITGSGRIQSILSGPNSNALTNNLDKVIKEVFGTDVDKNTGGALIARLPDKLQELSKKLGGDVVKIIDDSIQALDNLDRQFLQDFNRLNSSIVGNRAQLNQAFQGLLQAQDVLLQLNGQRRSAGSANAAQAQITNNLLGAGNQGINLRNRQSVLSVAQSLRSIINNDAVPANQRAEANLRLQGLTKALEANTNQTIRLSAAQERLAELQRTQQNARNFVAGLASGDPRAISELNQRLRDLGTIRRGGRLPADRFSNAIGLVDSATSGLRDDQFQQFFNISRQGGQNNLQAGILGRALGFGGAGNRNFISALGQNIFAGQANAGIAAEQNRIAQIFQDQASAVETLRQIQLQSINDTRDLLVQTNRENTEALQRVFEEQLKGGAITVSNEIKGEVQVTHNGLEVLRDLESKIKSAVESVIGAQVPISPANGIP